MFNSRIVAIALISIILSSSSFSVADGYTVWVDISDIKSAKQDFKNESKFYNIDLIDGIAASIDENPNKISNRYEINLIDDVSGISQNNANDNNQIFKINIFDGILSALNNNNAQHHIDSHSKNISINLSDVVD